ncbi:ribonuclease III [Leucobacter sp. UT-8R-CII-1-4]|uniref:ribonuclease III n=1 Tax=Leucobacter sp. UT-8R-CII-1-4 TaxID=3040075 RepID=UPI0024A9F616|nr:ribonuclease III [Leucobacter sp. UT-8R-CII-1-4]MDI6023196.1 ribonuclease III [Leucobacter sp. UT-8R-CII-1-4]
MGKPSNLPQGELGGFLAPFGVAVDPDLLRLALTHRSWAYENGGSPHNERLEFLGDSILGQAVTVKLFTEYPDLSEGELSRRRAALVSSVALAEVARTIGVGDQLLLGVGEERSGGREKESLLADAVEAIIGAVYLSTDPATAARFVLDLVAPLIADPERFSISLDPKTTVQEEADARGVTRPGYDIVGSGPDHDRRFHATVKLDGVVGEGSGISKKAAEIAAARELVLKLRDLGALKHRKSK